MWLSFLARSRLAQAALAVAVGVGMLWAYGAYKERQGALQEREKARQVQEDRENAIRESLRDIRDANQSRDRLRNRPK